MNFLIVDDHGIFRSGLKIILTDIYPSATILEANCAQDTLQIASENHDIDLAFIDLNLPDSSGVDLLKQLQKEFRTLPCAIISADDRAATIRTALANGALGYIPKSANNAIIISAIQLVLSGGIYAPHELLESAPDSALSNPTNMTTKINLTSRQKEVLHLIAKGMANKQICEQLTIAPGTTKAHISAIFNELKVTSRTLAIARAHELNLI